MCVNYPQYNPAIGISKKITDQIETFEKMGYEVHYSAYTDRGIGIYCGKELVEEHVFPQGKLDYYLRRFRLLSICYRYIKAHKFDLGFIRWGAADVQFIKVLKIMDKNCDRVLMDFHGYFPHFSPVGIKGWYTAITNVLNSHYFVKFIDLGLAETRCKKVYGINVINMDTCIDVDKYNRHCYEGIPDYLNMISVANERDYHGYDRIILGVSNYVKNTRKKDVYLHLVGKMSERTVQLINSLDISEFVILHGYKSGEELNDIYKKCNIGVGPLAPHRVGGKEGTGIKTKEYFALGLPYFYAGQELLVPDDYPYVYRISDGDEPVDINKVISFYESIKNDRSVQDNMRDFARENFSWEKLFDKAIKMMEQ